MHRTGLQTRWRWPAIALLWLGCAASGEQSIGGGENLPSNDYYSAELQQGDLLFVEGSDIERPWGISQSGEIQVWFGLRTPATDDTEESVAIATSTIAEVPITDVPITDDAMATEDEPASTTRWEASPAQIVLEGGTQPSVLETNDGLTMMYVSGGAIHRATSADGETWDVHGVTLAATLDWEAGALKYPSLVSHGGPLTLFYLADDGLGVGVAHSTDGGVSFTRAGDAPIFAPSMNPGEVEGEEPVILWDSDPITSLSVQRITLGTGRSALATYYAVAPQVGYAASIDSKTWFRSDLNPILGASRNADEPMRVGPLLLMTRGSATDKKRRALVTAVFGVNPG